MSTVKPSTLQISKSAPELSSQEVRFLILTCVFISCMSFINVVSAKLWDFGGLTISGGIMAYWLTFPITDAIGEVFGKRRAFLVVWMGLLANILVLAMSKIAVALPPADIYQDQAALKTTLASVPLIVIASMLAYLLAQLHDVWAFDFWKRVTKGHYLWLRNNLSTMSSQLIDSLVFNGIAFYIFATDRMSLTAFLTMTVGYWVFKICIAIVDTPVVYLLVAWLRSAPTDAGPEHTQS